MNKHDSTHNPVAAKKPLNVMILISGLTYGGAERQVIELMKQFDRRIINPILCTLTDNIPLAKTLPNRENELFIIRKKWKFDFTTVFRVARLARAHNIDLMHTFLFDAEIAGRIAARLARIPVMLGSERNSDYKMPFIHRFFQHLTKRWMNGLIANSNAGKRFIEKELKLPPETVYVIHNGIDINFFYPAAEARNGLRTELGIAEDARVIGMIANFKTQKRHDIFLRMARKVLDEYPDTWFLVIGESVFDSNLGVNPYRDSILQLTDELNLRERCLYLGNRNDMLAVYNACDVTVLTSSREGTPNVLLESMACGVPVIASDIADNAAVVQSGKTGYIVPFADVDEFTSKCLELLSDRNKCRSFGDAAREWVTEAFSTAVLARKTETVYTELYRQKLAQKPSK